MPENSRETDVIIIGGGPAGLSALLWSAELGLRAVIFEREREFGGQLLWTYNTIRNYLGAQAENGRELRDRFLQTVENIDDRSVVSTPVVKVDLDRRMVESADGARCLGRAVIIATGVRRRRLNIPGENEFAGGGILESGVKSASELHGKTVLIVGGGDAALENALILGATARKVYVVHRRSEFTARAEFVEKARSHERIDFLFDSRVAAIRGDRAVSSVDVEHMISTEGSTIAVDSVLIRIGVEPNSELFRGQLAIDEAGYLTTDRDCSTAKDGIFAVGDVANPYAKTINTAVGNGATAARAILRLLGSDLPSLSKTLVERNTY